MTITQRVRRLFGDERSGGPYECGCCGQRFDLNRQSCTQCGSYLVERATYEDLLTVDQSA